MPEVESLAGFLRERAVERAFVRADITAITALKTYDPPISSLVGLPINDVQRHGKFLDISRSRHPPGHPPGPRGLAAVAGGAVAGAAAPGKGPIAMPGGARRRLRVRPDRGRHTEKARRLRRPRPAEVPGIAKLGPDPFTLTSTREFGRHPEGAAGRRSRACCATSRSSPGSATRTPTSPARGEDVALQARRQPDRRELQQLYDAISRPCATRSTLFGPPRGTGPEVREEERHAGARPDRREVPGLWRHRQRGQLRRLLLAVLRRPARRAASPWPTGGCPNSSNNSAKTGAAHTSPAHL